MLPIPSWMVSADVLIIQFLNGHERPFVIRPTAVSKNISISDSHAQRRLRHLQEAGLVESVADPGYYMITEDGQRFHSGTISREELETREPEL